VLVGGIAFRTPPEAFADAPAQSAHRFDLFADEASATRRQESVVQPAVMVFRESVRGLAVGAAVDFRGIQVGEVRSIGFAPRGTEDGLAILVRVDLYPDRLRSEPAAERSPDGLIEALVRRGLRAQLRQGNLLTGQLYVALDFVAGRPPPALALAEGELSIPTAASAFTEIQATLASVAQKLERLPLDALVSDLRGTLRSVDATLAGAQGTLSQAQGLIAAGRDDIVPELRRAVGELRDTLAGTRELVAADAPVQAELRNALQELARAAESVRLLAETIERQPEALLRGKRDAP
jgi:paraquat-inducible protein B